MTGTAHSLTIDRVRTASRRTSEYLAQQMHELGADPMTLAQEALGLGGLEFFERWLGPEIPAPPAIAVLFGAEWVEIERSRAAAALEPAEWMFNPFGALWGGITATVLDVVLSAAIHTTLPAGTGYATSDLHIRYMRAMTPGTPVPVKSSPTWNPPWLGPLRMHAIFTSSVRSLMFENCVRVPSAATSSKL